MTQPLVSIIIPCFNAADYVGEAIESALVQTYSPIEVIVIDDGSTDGSLEVVRSFGDQIRWETGPNRGACAARNRGLDLSNGDFIQFLDTDDILHSDKLQQQIPHAVERIPQITFCRWKSVVCSDDSGHLHCARLHHADAIVLAIQKIISTPAPLFPIQSLREIGGWRENLPCAQDYDLNLRLACAGATFWELPEVLVTLRRIPGSVSSDMVRILDEFCDIYWRAYRGLVRDGQMTDERAAAFAGGFANHGRVYLRLGETEKAIARFRDAYRMHPSGGLNQAYRTASRLLRRLLGPIATETIVQAKRRLARRVSWNQ